MKKIKDFENYTVYTDGTVINTDTNYVKKATLGKHGYYCLDLQYLGSKKKFLVHRLVAMAYIPNPDNLPYVNHMDGCKTNNNLDNLEWCTPKHNAQHASKMGLLKRDYSVTDTQVKEWLDFVLLGNTYAEAKGKFNFGVPYMSVKCKELANRLGVGKDLEEALRLQKKIRTVNNSNKIKQERGRQVSQYSLDGTFIKSFDTIRDATRATGTRSGGIVNVLNGRCKTANGFIWKPMETCND